ncbi:MAG: response regulator [Myxococcota bacterium]
MRPGTGVVLLVEDEPTEVTLVQRAFRDLAIANPLECVHDGEAALLRLGIGQPSVPTLDVALVLLDLKLPKIHGLEVLRRIREDPRTHALRVVVLTSSFDDEERLATFELGGNSFIRKPMEWSRFAEAIRRVGLYWLLVDEGPPGA